MSPTIMPACVGGFAIVAALPVTSSDTFAMPKSRRVTPAFVTRMFEGFRSRWMMPC